MSQPFWDDPQPGVVDYNGISSPSPVDQFVIAGLLMPGIASVTGKRRKRTDKKKTPGKDGHIPTHLGYDAAEISVKLTIWTPDQWEAFQAAIPVIQPKRGKGNPKPFEVFHPFLAVYGITSLYVEDISLPVAKGKQIFEVTLTLTEFNPADTGSVETNKKIQAKNSDISGGKVRPVFSKTKPSYAKAPTPKPPSSGSTGP